MAEPQRYRVYLLRLWQVLGDDGIPIWRAALEEAHTSERHGFGTLVELVTFLESQTVHWNQEASLSESET